MSVSNNSTNPRQRFSNANYQSLSDRVLVDHIVHNNDAAAFLYLIRERYGDALKATISQCGPQADFEEVYSEVILYLYAPGAYPWEKLDQWNGGNSILPWLKKVFLSTYRDRSKTITGRYANTISDIRKHHNASVSMDDDTSAWAELMSEQNGLDRCSTHDLSVICDCIEHLNEPFRTVLKYRLAGFDNPEISEKMAIEFPKIDNKVSNVANILARAKKKLAADLDRIAPELLEFES